MISSTVGPILTNRLQIGLGTVQFGLPYGIANRGIRPAISEVREILDYAAEEGVTILDTAAVYGDAERIIGGIIRPEHKFKIVTKSPAFGCQHISNDHANILENSLNTSLKYMRLEMLYGLLIHSGDDLLTEGGERLIERAMRLKELGKVAKVGVSVYEPLQTEKILDRYRIDLIQLPLNVLDQRFFSSGILSQLKDSSIEVHARSAFLQGALLMSPDQLPPHFECVMGTLLNYRNTLIRLGITPMQAAIDFIKRQPSVHAIVVGVCSVKQLKDILDAYRLPKTDIKGFEPFAVHKLSVIDPRKWPQ
tara:strand:+ start:1487 stop:2407 length:921 start_codon:yes stop_codon:yes gene_type:complete